MLALILAGGKSRRMGRDKAQLPFRGQTLLAYQIQRFREAGFEVAVSRNMDENTTLVLRDIFPDGGPMAGLHAAFSRQEVTTLFLTAVDLPLASIELAKVLLQSLRAQDDACVVRRRSGRIEPLFGVYRRRCLPRIESLLRAGDGSMYRLLESVNTRFLEENQIQDFCLELELQNMNTPDDYASLLTL